MLKYFVNIETIEELKKVYKELAKKHHPDLGGSKEEFQELNNEYDLLFKSLKNKKANKKANTKDNKDGDKFKDIINELIKYNELTIEIIGSWLWISGNTYPLRNIIKSLGLLWSKGRKKWYYTADTIGANTHYKKKTYDQLKNDYGYTKIKSGSTKDKDKDKNYLK